MNSIIAKVLSILPVTSSFRGVLYKLIWHGRIGKKFKIGFGSYIDSAHIQIGNNASIGNMVRIKYLDGFKMGNDSSIGSSTVVCGAYETNRFRERQFTCGDNVEILCSHYFDVVAPIILGNDVTIAGKWTQFYTHSFDLVPNRLDGAIQIGNRVYIGAAALINLGVTVCDNVVIQGGCVVNKDITEPGVYASQTIYKRGNVRCYADLFADKPNRQLETGITVYSANGDENE